MTQNRLQKELHEMVTGPPSNCSAGLKDPSDLFNWQAVIVGPESTPFEGGMFKLNITFPNDYPFKPPKANQGV
ncbi:hypothetical protein MRX96_016702 [Rhipicephalus microplus]